MAQFSAIASGQAQWIDPFSAPLQNRISTQMSQWFGIQDVQIIDTSHDLLSFYYQFQARIVGDTRNLPATVENISEKIKLGVYLATGFVPTVAVTSAGHAAPGALEPGVVDELAKWPRSIASLVTQVSEGLGTTIQTAKYLVIAIGLGLIALVYFIASNPGRAARIARA
jgi:hypothetical protein